MIFNILRSSGAGLSVLYIRFPKLCLMPSLVTED